MNIDVLKDLSPAEPASAGDLPPFGLFAAGVYPFLEFRWFHEAYYRVLEAFAAGRVRRLIVTMPPQHGKSVGASTLLPAYLLGRNPDLRIAIASYSASLASKFNRRVQRIIDSPEYAAFFPETTIKRGARPPEYLRTADEVEIIGHRGGLLSVGREGALTGNRVDCFILDDLYAGWDATKPIVDCIAPDGDFNAVTGALSAVGLGDVPAWLRPFPVLSNGEKFRAGLARLVCERPKRAVVDEFTSVIDRQIAKVGAAAFAKTWRKGDGQVVLLSCHYDIIEWLQPDWVYDMQEARFYNRDCLQRRPQLKLQIYKVRGTVFPRLFKQHYYLDLPAPVAAEYFVGFINGEPVCHVAVSPLFTAGAYRATRLVVMPEWQGIGVGTKFLAAVCEYHRQGHGRCGKMLPVFFHTSHPQLCGALRHSRKWVQTAASLYGANKTKSISSLIKSAARKGQPGRPTSGYGGHFRAVQAFKYINNGC